MKKILFCTFSAVLLFACKSSETKEEASTPTETVAPAEKKEMPAEIADEKYVEIAKKVSAAVTSGNIDAWMELLAENAIYRWNTGDSLKGKAAISGYWKKRRGVDIDSLTYHYPVYLPIKVNQPQQPQVTEGVWVLSWYQAEAKYKKSGKKMRQWVHTDMHFDSNDKIDQIINYIDMGAVRAAEKK